jgi:hypothetical protein
MVIRERIEDLLDDDCSFESHGQVLVAENETELAAVGFSLHGFQLGPGAVAVMTELIVNGGTQTRIGDLGIDRFRPFTCQNKQEDFMTITCNIRTPTCIAPSRPASPSSVAPSPTTPACRRASRPATS